MVEVQSLIYNSNNHSSACDIPFPNSFNIEAQLNPRVLIIKKNNPKNIVFVQRQFRTFKCYQTATFTDRQLGL